MTRQAHIFSGLRFDRFDILTHVWRYRHRDFECFQFLQLYVFHSRDVITF